MKLLKVMCVIALVFAVSAIAYAETQSVKVSGDIAVDAFARNNYNLNRDTAAVVNNGSRSTSWETYLQSTTEIQIDADLTDNVSGVIRLVNQRAWGDAYYTDSGNISGSTNTQNTPFPDQFSANATNPANADAFNIGVDLAYIELKEFLYSPLTLKIGRQDLWFGKGFIIGANQRDPYNSIYAKEYTAYNSFDAVRATLDYDPWTIDAVYAKISENSSQADDDTNLYGVNVGYVFDNYNAEAEAYWWYKQNKNTGTANIANSNVSVINGHNNSDVHTLGLRGSFDPIEDWTMALEGAFQVGSYLGANNQVDDRSRSAWAIDAIVECRYWQDDFAWRPVVGLEYIFYSGETNLGNTQAVSNGDYKGWDSMYRGKFDTAIREYQNVWYATATNSSPANTNQHQIIVRGTIEPTDSLTVDMLYANFWLASEFATDTTVNNQNEATYVGQEVDLKMTWDYTEDVQFGVLSAWFFPGDTFGSTADSIATDVVGSVKLSF
ncbi:MAG: alginate export family protein [Candidatus Tantalella remota]|nr:alginate export family protein [Candidatus Tantalella remota]